MNFIDKIKSNGYFKKLKNNKIEIRNIKEQYLTSEICFFEVKRHMNYFRKMPQNLINQEICSYVFDECIEYFEFIPEQFITKEMCDKIVDDCGYYTNLVKFVPNKYRNNDFYFKIITSIRNFMEIINFEEVFDNLKQMYIDKTLELRPDYIIKFDNKYLSEDDWLKAINSNEELIGKLPNMYKNDNFYKKLIELNPDFIGIIPLEQLSQPLYNLAFLKKPELIKYFPDQYITKEMAEYVKQNLPQYIKKVPTRFQDNYEIVSKYNLLKDSLNKIISVKVYEKSEIHTFKNPNKLQKEIGYTTIPEREEQIKEYNESRNVDFLIKLIIECGKEYNINTDKIINIYSKLIDLINQTNTKDITRENIDLITNLSIILSEKMMNFINEAIIINNSLPPLNRYSYYEKNSRKIWDDEYEYTFSINNTVEVMKKSIEEYSSRINKEKQERKIK